MSAPSISAPGIVDLVPTAATVAAALTSAGGGAISAVGVVYALTALNAAPAIGGGSVTNVTASSLAVAPFTVPLASLAPGQSYTFAAYATNGTGTTYTAFVQFTTPALAVFITCTGSDEGETVYVRLRNGKKDTISKVTRIDAIGQPFYSGFYRDLFTNVSPSDVNIGVAATDLVGATYAAGGQLQFAATTGLGVSDDAKHHPLRQAEWLEGGLLFTTASGLQFPFLWKDMIGPSNTLTSEWPTNVTS